VYERCGWRALRGRGAVLIDETGREVPKVDENVTMYYPVGGCEFPDGLIHLRGNDW